MKLYSKVDALPHDFSDWILKYLNIDEILDAINTALSNMTHEVYQQDLKMRILGYSVKIVIDIDERRKID